MCTEFTNSYSKKMNYNDLNIWGKRSFKCKFFINQNIIMDEVF